MDELSPGRDRLDLLPAPDDLAPTRSVDSDDPLVPGWEDYCAARNRFFAAVRPGALTESRSPERSPLA